MNQKPWQRLYSEEVLPVLVNGTTFNTSLRGLGNLKELRPLKYGNGFRQATFGELVNYISEALSNLDCNSALRTVKAIRSGGVIGATVIYGRKDDLLVLNHPELVDGRIPDVTVAEKILSREYPEDSNCPPSIFYSKTVGLLRRNKSPTGGIDSRSLGSTFSGVFSPGDSENFQKNLERLANFSGGKIEFSNPPRNGEIGVPFLQLQREAVYIVYNIGNMAGYSLGVLNEKVKK